MSVSRIFWGGIDFPKITYHVFTCDSENYMEKLFGNYFLGKSHFSYTKNVFGINFATISGWSVVRLKMWGWGPFQVAEVFFLFKVTCPGCPKNNQRKTKGQQLKGKIARHSFTLFGTSPQLFTLFQNFSFRTFS